MATNSLWSKIGRFLKTTFLDGGWHWSKEDGWQPIREYIAEHPEDKSASAFMGFGGQNSKNGLLSNLFNKFTGGGLTDAENQINDFNASQAEADRVFQSHEAALQRDWSSQEAEIARDWQEEMYYKYNSLSGKIAQAEEAGVNPMFAVTNNAVTPMSASSSVPSGASSSGSRATGGGFASQSFTDLIGMVLGLVKAKYEINLMESEADRNYAEADKTGKEASWIDKLSEAQLENLLTSTTEIESRIHVNSETANKLSAEALKLQKEGVRLAKITDAEVRLTEANAILAEFNSSVYKILDDFDNASTDDYIKAGAKLLANIVGFGVQMSPKGIVHLK